MPRLKEEFEGRTTQSLLITPEMAKVPDKCLFFVFKDNKLYLEVETSILKVKCKL